MGRELNCGTPAPVGAKSNEDRSGPAGWSATRTCKPVENNYSRRMAKKASGAIGGASSTSPKSEKPAEKLGRRGTPPSETHQKSSARLDTRVVYCGDNLEQLAKLPDACVDLIYSAPPFNSNRNWPLSTASAPSSSCGRRASARPNRLRHKSRMARCAVPANEPSRYRKLFRLCFTVTGGARLSGRGIEARRQNSACPCFCFRRPSLPAKIFCR